MGKKRRTPAQLRATKKLVALNRRRARQNKAGPKKTWRRRAKSARQMKRGHKATAAWVRAGMPSQRNRKRKTVCNPRRKGLTVQQAIRLAKAARRGVTVGIKRTKKGYSVVTGKAARALAKRKRS